MSTVGKLVAPTAWEQVEPRHLLPGLELAVSHTCNVVGTVPPALPAGRSSSTVSTGRASNFCRLNEI